jgi:predicted methyltransferase
VAGATDGANIAINEVSAPERVSDNARQGETMKTLLACTLALLAVSSSGADPAPDAAIRAAIAAPERTEADRERDQRDKSAEILAFAGVKPGMTVADLFSAGGYYAELLAGAVGPQGKVYAVNNVPYALYSKKAREARFTEGRLPNVEHKLVEASWFTLPPRSVDLAVIVMSYHDVFWVNEKEGWPAIHTSGFLDSVKRSLKPGGRLLVIDHNAPAGSGPEMAGKSHRLNEDFAKQSLTSNGFVLEKTYDGLRNKDDQLDKLVFDESVKGKTDRYVHLYRMK